MTPPTAVEVRTFEATVPAGTAESAGWSQLLPMPPRQVQRIVVRVPPGPRGTVGFAVQASGIPVIPLNAGEWIVTDDEVIDWQLSDLIDSGAWSIAAYNTGTYDHTLYVRFELAPVTPAGQSIVQPLAIAP